MNDTNNETIRILIIQGDTDPALNSLAAQNWTEYLNLTETEAWRPWTIDGEQYVGGFVTTYQTRFQFATVRGSGHMVP